MATATLATADAILKDLYRGPIIDQLNYKTYMLDMIERDADSVDFTGRRAIVPVESTGNESPTSMPDNGTLATPGAALEQDAIINIRFHNGAVEISDMLIESATGSNAGAFVNELDRQTDRLAKSMRKNINRQVFGDGTGTLATLATSPAAATTFTVDSTQYLRTNMVVDVLQKSNGTVRAAGLTISNVNRTTKVVTVSANVTATLTTDGVYKEGAYGFEMDGLRNITGKGRTLHGINSATSGNEFWNGSERDADTYQSTKRFNNAQAVEIHGGYTAIFVNEIPVVIDDDTPKGWAFGLRKDAFAWFELAAPDWLSDPKTGLAFHLAMGSTLGKRRAAWTAWFRWYAALGSLAPNRTGRIINAADDSA
jgi:hypothetical protein